MTRRFCEISTVASVAKPPSAFTRANRLELGKLPGPMVRSRARFVPLALVLELLTPRIVYAPQGPCVF